MIPKADIDEEIITKVFETEPNDLLYDDQGFDLLEDVFASEEKKLPASRFQGNLSPKGSGSARIHFRTKRL